MLRKTIEYRDMDGNKLKEDFYFHLYKAEVYELLITNKGCTLDKYLERIKSEGRGKDTMDFFKEFIKMSYGKKSLDNKGFEKNDQIWEDFHRTEAYSNLFVELVTDGKKAAEFVNGVIPKDLADEIEKIIRENPDAIPDEMKDYLLDSEEKSSENVVPINK